MADLDPESLNKLRVVDLKEYLSARGLPISGLKAELVKRLRDALLHDDTQNGSGGDARSNIQQTGDEPMDIDEEHEKEDSDTEEDEQACEEIRMRDDKMPPSKEARLTEKRQVAEETRLAEERQTEVARFTEERKQAEEARLKAENEKRQAEAARRTAEDEWQRMQEAKLTEARLKADEERLAEQARLKAVKEQQQAEEERQRAEEARLRVEQERQWAEKIKQVEEAEKRHKAIEAQLAEEARIRAEEEARQKLEERKRQAVEEQKIQEEKRKADEVRRMAEEEEMKLEQERWLVEEQMRKAQEDHKKRMKAEEQKRLMEQERQKKIAEAQRRVLEEERQKMAAEEQRRRVLEEERQKMVAEQRRQALEEERQKAAVEEQRRVALEEERQKAAAEQRRRAVEEERQKAAAEEQRRSALEEERQKKAVEEQKRIMDEERQRRVEEEKVRMLILEQQKNTEEQKRMMEQEQNKIVSEDEQLVTDAEIKLPQAIEKVLALKSERAQLLGVDPDSVVQPIPVVDDRPSLQKFTAVTLVPMDEDELYGEDDNSTSKNKESKSRRRKKKKKKKHNTKPEVKKETSKRSEKSSSKESSVDIDVEYVQEVLDVSDPLYFQFMKIFERFKLADGEKEKEEAAANAAKDATKEENINPLALRKKPLDLDDDDDDERDDDDKIEEEKPKLSKRKLKKLSRMTVAELKQKVNRPELVEMHDVTAKDPVLLLHLKASRNTVPVPRHWCFKRKYLQGKRGIEKPAFELPDFIKRTGIMEMRQALQEKEDQKTMKAKMRERVRPKLGKIDIDYQKLHDAFFKWQTKPKMTIHGDLYYEGKEFETRLKEKKPGDLSEDLRTALGMPTGPNAHKCPPPWLIAMQRYGPPPSYPNLKIPGLNAPIPEDCSFGYHAGGWGKPPVDETGRPLYGDVFGTQISDNQPHIQEEEIDHTLWGELESESSEEEDDEDEEEDDEEEEKIEDETGLVTPAEGLITPSGFSSIPAGMETPDMIELRKRKIESEIEGGETPALYTILPEKKTERVGAAMMGSTHIYDIAAAIPASKLKIPGTSSVPPQGIEVALDPSELEMDSAAMAARYEQTMREQQSQLEKEDLSDMVAEHAARQKNKRKKQQLTSAKPPKKYKEFKF